MIQQQDSNNTWQQALRDAITDPLELLSAVHLTTDQVSLSLEAATQFRCKVPLAYVAKMKLGDADDPLLLQVLPTQQEMLAVPGYSHDPLGEQAVNPVPGVLHKYRSRVLLTVASRCAVNCRYCFRRHFDYDDNSPGIQGWDAALAYIAAQPEIKEVILSGGDPLMLKDSLLQALAEKIAAIPQVTTLRIHTRLPVVIPERISDALCHWLGALPLQCVMVLHCNHPNEIDAVFAAKCQQLKQANVTLLNQAVLLRRVNDDAKVLCALSEKLFAVGIMPYYLHCLDKVAGAAHFALTDREIQTLYRELLDSLPGYLVPKLVTEMPGATSKVPYALDYHADKTIG